jgi:DNA-binding HxlR family transcriptional regulator
MKRTDTKSHCPVNFALESFGDPWSLLIVRDIAFWGKHRYSEFLDSDEGISTNILAARLAQLEKQDIIYKSPSSDSPREHYMLTEKGIALVPVLLEMSGWSATYDALTTAPMDFVRAAYADRTTIFAMAQEKVRQGGALFTS